MGRRGLAGRPFRQQPVVFFFDHGIALTGHLLEPRTIEYPDMAARIADEARFLQLKRPFGDPFAAYALPLRLIKRLDSGTWSNRAVPRHLT